MKKSLKKQVITDEWNKKRLDHFLAAQYIDISRAYLQRLCSNDEVAVNSVPQKGGYKLKVGDQVRVLHDMDSVGKPPDITLPIIYEDDDLLVIDKPSGILAHGLSKFHEEPSVASFLRQKTNLIANTGERAGIVHRLDRATSGIMICAKNDLSMKFLQKQFADRTIKKTYFAVVNGSPDISSAVIDVGLERNPKAPATWQVGSGGKSAQTIYKVLKSNTAYSLIELTPLTGRTHQLRVHMYHIGHSIVGDVLYSGEPASRLLLHAGQLKIKLPSGRKQTFTSPIPKIYKDYIK